MNLHSFSKYLFDVIIAVIWIYVPMFLLNLHYSEFAILWWTFTVVSLGGFLYLLHSMGSHSIYA